MNSIHCEYPGCNLPLHYDFDRKYCLGHTAIENKHVSIDEFNKFVRDKIRRNELNFDGFIFISTDFISSNEFSRIQNDIQLTNCQFLGSKQLGDEIHSLEFFGVTFHKSIDFSGSFFNSSIRFNNCRFNQKIIFNNVVINGSLNIIGGVFKNLIAANLCIAEDIKLLNDLDIGELSFEDSKLGGLSTNKEKIFSRGLIQLTHPSISPYY